MNRQDAELLMQRHLDGDLSHEEQQRLARYVQQHPEVQEEFNALQALSDQLEQLPKVVPPRSVVDDLIPEMHMTDNPPHKSVWSKMFHQRFLVTGIVLAAAVLLLIWYNENNFSLEFVSLGDREQNDSVHESVNEDGYDGSNFGSDDSPTESAQPSEEPAAESNDESGDEDSNADVDDISSIWGEPRLVERSPAGTYVAFLTARGDDIRVNLGSEPFFASRNHSLSKQEVIWMEWLAEAQLYYIVYDLGNDDFEFWTIKLAERPRDVQELQLAEAHEHSILSEAHLQLLAVPFRSED